ncbi:MAG TPA: hypothetical protein VLN74_14890 [Ilumatobacteraceae bacterium]|nr:hypothetical protein [Ilumatobacteraceae bacterium]
MSDHDDVRSSRDVDADAERFLDEDADDPETGLTSALDLPPDGSIPDIIDQRTVVPEDDEP